MLARRTCERAGEDSQTIGLRREPARGHRSGLRGCTSACRSAERQRIGGIISQACPRQPERRTPQRICLQGPAGTRRLLADLACATVHSCRHSGHDRQSPALSFLRRGRQLPCCHLDSRANQRSTTLGKRPILRTRSFRSRASAEVPKSIEGCARTLMTKGLERISPFGPGSSLTFSFTLAFGV